ncbi:MAG: hypothetical protein HY897_11120 [Deltaproteobacteria bacterium]|nr:hypothetical protein [Deltaproteobacteria bacterium]
MKAVFVAFAFASVVVMAAAPAWAQKAKKKGKPPAAGQPSSGASFDDLMQDLQETEPGAAPAMTPAPSTAPAPVPQAPSAPPPAYDDLPPLPATSSPPALRPPPAPPPPLREVTTTLPPAVLDAKTAGPTKVLVMDLGAEGGVYGQAAASMTLAVIDSIRRLNAYKVMGLKDLYSLPPSARKPGCMGSSCLIDASGAEYLVEGSVDVRDAQYVLFLRLTDRKIPIQVSSVVRSLPVDAAGRSGVAAAAVRELFEPLVTTGTPAPPLLPSPRADSAQPATSSPPAVRTSAPEPPASRPYRLWWILSFAGSGAFIGGGFVTHSLAVTEASEYGKGYYLTVDEQNSAADRFSSYRALTITGYTVGGVLLAAGAVLLGLDLTSPADTGAVSAVSAGDRFALKWSW